MQKKDVRTKLISVLLYIPFHNLLTSKASMTKILFIFLSLFSLTSSYAMRAPLRVRACPQQVFRMAHTAIAPRIRASMPRRHYSDDQTEAKRQEMWARIHADVAERINELKAQGAKHRAKAAQHTNYARAFETLAALEKDKLDVFALSIDKINAAAVAFEYGEVEPTLDNEANLIKVLTETYEEFYNALPEKDKFHLENKF